MRPTSPNSAASWPTALGRARAGRSSLPVIAGLAFAVSLLLLAATLGGAPAGPGVLASPIGDVTTGLIWTVAGRLVVPGFWGDGGPATNALLNTPVGVAVDSAGNAYIADQYNHRVRRVDGATGIITTVAGAGACDAQTFNCAAGYDGDNKPATQALLNNPMGVALDSTGSLYVADTTNHRVRKVTNPGPNGVITTVAGNGTWGMTVDGAVATGTPVGNPNSLVFDAQDNMYILQFADAGGGGFANRVLKVNASDGKISTIVGVNTTQPGYGGDGGAALYGVLNVPIGLAIDAGGALYIADNWNNRVRKVSGGVITTIAGTGVAGYTGDGGSATQATIRLPRGVAVDRLGNVYIADTFNTVIRQVSATDQKIRTVVGGSGIGAPVSGGSALVGWFWNPQGLTVGANGNLYITDPGNSRVWRAELLGLGDPTAPVITASVTGTLGNNDWYRGDVTIGWTVTDPESSITSTSGCTNSTLTSDSTGTQYTCTATSGGGSNSKTVTVKRDATNPTVTITTPPNGASYPPNANVLSNFGCADTTSGLASCTGTVANNSAISTSPSGAKTFSVTATDNAGNSTTLTHNYSVGKVTPTISWNNPAAITYGTALSNTQLSATVDGGIQGTLTFNPALGTVLNAGTHTLTVTFDPADATTYNQATKTVTLVVNKATPVITWNNPAAITYGTALSNTQLSATVAGNLPGNWVYTPPLGEVLNAGTHTLSVTFNPQDSTNYSPATKTVTITVGKATPVITWNNPARITYGTALSNTQLNASVAGNIPGRWDYNPGAGVVLQTGDGQVLQVTFTPDDTTNYTPATKTVTIDVGKTTPIIVWNAPASIVEGTPLSATQLNAALQNGPIAGLWTYTPPLGTLLPPGINQVLSVTFTPNDAANFTSATTTVTIDVIAAVPLIRSVTPPTGPTWGGTLVTISGERFLPGATVTFGLNPASNITVVSGNTITATTPPHAAGGVDVIVFNPSGLANGFNQFFTYVEGSGNATRTLPACYVVGGGRTVTIVVTPDQGVSNYAVEDKPPANWTVSGISHGGLFDPQSGKVKWGPFFDAAERTLTYVVTPPTGTVGTGTWSGVVSFDGTNVPIAGAAELGRCGTHPADLDDNWQITVSEITAYGAAWKRGDTWVRAPNPIRIEDVTRGGFLWRNGELYHLTPAECPLCWVPGAAVDLGLPATSRVVATFGGPSWVQPSFASASVSGRPRPGAVLTMRVRVTPAPGTAAWAVEDRPPAGWEVTAVSGGGQWDATSGLIRWGPFFDDAPRTLEYEVMVPSLADDVESSPSVGAPASSRVRSTPYRFAGVASFDGTRASIAGARSLRVGPRATDGDYDGDGRADLAVVDPSAGVWTVPPLEASAFGRPGELAVPADYDGDGRTDRAVFDPQTGAWHVDAQFELRHGAPGDLPVPADYDGDGRADVATFRPATGEWDVFGEPIVSFGFPGDIPVPADYDGDGRADLAVFRPETGTWFVNGAEPVVWGRAGDIPMPADYNGDGVTDVAVFRPATGEWLIAGEVPLVWGDADRLIPSALDIDGDGCAELCVYNPTIARWECLSLSTGDGRSFVVGGPGSIPAGRR